MTQLVHVVGSHVGRVVDDVDVEVDDVVEVVLVVVGGVWQTPSDPHTPEQQSVPPAGGKQPACPSSMQPTHVPVVVSQTNWPQTGPQVPPQPSGPQNLPVQSGVQVGEPSSGQLDGAGARRARNRLPSSRWIVPPKSPQKREPASSMMMPTASCSMPPSG